MKTALLSEIGVGVEFMTLITERRGKKVSDYSFKHGGTWVTLYPSNKRGNKFPKETVCVHDMTVGLIFG